MNRKVRKSGKLVYGWGINDVEYKVTKNEIIGGKWKTVGLCPYYLKWSHVLLRCFDQKYQERNPTYKDCTVCEDWKYLSNFIRWVDSQPNKDWINCNLDKDFLVEGNKHYSPGTCVFITKSLNSFIVNRSKSRGEYLIGVCRHGSTDKDIYISQCNDPFKNEARYLGRYPTEIQAHKAWQAKKHEYACKLADLQTDERVAKALRERYAPDKDWAKKL